MVCRRRCSNVLLTLLKRQSHKHLKLSLNSRPAAPVQRPPTLMDHTVALRQEVAALRNELHAVAQVTDAVGQAVGQLYQTFLGQSEFTDQSGAYEAQAPELTEDY